MPRRFANAHLWYYLVILALSSPFGCASRGPSKVSIRLKWLHQAQFAGFYYAKESGIYAADKSVNVTLQPGGVDSPAIQLVASGSDQFGVTGADQILIAREKGIPVVAVACIYRKTPFVLFSLASSGIRRMDDLKGKKVGVKLGGNEELTYRAMMQKAGIPSSAVTEIPVKFDISPLLTNQVQVWPGYAINEPITAEEKGFPVNLIWPDQYGVRLYADVLFTTEEMIRTHPETVSSIVRATVKGWEQALANKEQAVTYTLRYGNQLTREHETKMLNASEALIKPDANPIGSMDPAVWREMRQFLRDLKFISTEVDLSQSFRTDFLAGGRP